MLYWPGGQAAQVAGVEAPSCTDAVPGMHGVQAAAPEKLEKVPAPQLRQALLLLEPSKGLYVPGVQLLRHASAPTASDHFPAGQALHRPELAAAA